MCKLLVMKKEVNHEAVLDRVMDFVSLEMGLTKAEFCRKLDIGTQNLNNWITRKKIPDSQLMKISHVIGKSIYWILYGREPQGLLDPILQESHQLAETKEIDSDRVSAIPQYRNAALSAGPGALNYDDSPDSEMYFKRSWIEHKGWNPRDLFVIYIRGQSMEPQLWDGDVVLINTALKTPQSGRVFAINIRGESKIKRLYTSISGTIWVKSDNPEHPDETIDPEEMDGFQILGQCVWRGSEIF